MAQDLVNNGPWNAKAYGEFLGKRYKHFDNILWLNGNDFGSWKNPIDDAVVLAVAKGTKSTDPAASKLSSLTPIVPPSMSGKDPLSQTTVLTPTERHTP